VHHITAAVCSSGFGLMRESASGHPPLRVVPSVQAGLRFELVLSPTPDGSALIVFAFQ